MTKALVIGGFVAAAIVLTLLRSGTSGGGRAAQQASAGRLLGLGRRSARMARQGHLGGAMGALAVLIRLLTGGRGRSGDLTSLSQQLFDGLMVTSQVELHTNCVIIQPVVQVLGAPEDVTFAREFQGEVERGVNLALMDYAREQPVRMPSPVTFQFVVDESIKPGRMVVRGGRRARIEMAPTSVPARVAESSATGANRQRNGTTEARVAPVNPPTLHPVGVSSVLAPIELRVGVSTVGRVPSAGAIVLDDPSVSREHARLEIEAGPGIGEFHVAVTDLHSRNGTWLRPAGASWLREEQVTQAELGHGDEVFFGDVHLRLVIGTSIMDPTAPTAGPLGKPREGIEPTSVGRREPAPAGTAHYVRRDVRGSGSNLGVDSGEGAGGEGSNWHDLLGGTDRSRP